MAIPIAQIIKIDAPSSAPAGSQVIVDVHLKNNSTGLRYLAVTGVYDSTQFPFQFDYLYVAPYETVVFRGWFTMPSKKVRVMVWSWYWDVSNWVLDEEKYVDISLADLVPGFSELVITSFSKV